MSASTSSPGAASQTISRTLDDGWDYAPDWRLQQVDEYLTRIAEFAEAKDRKAAVQDILFGERDPVVRQALRHRVNGVCAGTAATKAFAWAVRCARENARTGALSTLKAMVVAGIPPKVIAETVGTQPLHVFVAEKLFFEVRPYRRNRVWMRRVVLEPAHTDVLTPEQSRERMLLNVAFSDGPAKLMPVLNGEEDVSNESLESTAQKLEAITGRRALDFVQGLDRSGVAVSEDDLKRYVLARGMRSREAATTASDQNKKLADWGLSIVRLMNASSVSEFDAKTIQDVSQALPIHDMIAVAKRKKAERAALTPATGCPPTDLPPRPSSGPPVTPLPANARMAVHPNAAQTPTPPPAAAP